MLQTSSQRNCGWLLISSILALHVGCSGGSRSFESPQEVFEAAQASAAKKDYRGFAQCLTPDTQDNVAAMLAISGIMAKNFGAFAAAAGPDAKKAYDEKIAGVDKILSSHGLSKDSLAQKTVNTENMKSLVTQIKDKPAFIAEMMQAMQEVNGQDKEAAVTMSGTLTKVEITGDAATARIVHKENEKSSEEDVAFKKIDGGWLIELPSESTDLGPPR